MLEIEVMNINELFSSLKELCTYGEDICKANNYNIVSFMWLWKYVQNTEIVEEPVIET